MSGPTSPAQRRKRFERDTPPPFQITPRDIDLVRHVAQHRFLRSTHLSALVASPHKKVCDRLTALFHAGYLDRPRAQLEYHVKNGGSAPMVYELDARGARLLRENQVDTNAGRSTFKKREVRRPFVLHTLGIADFRVALKLSVRTRNDLTLFERTEVLRAAPRRTSPSHDEHGSEHVVPDDLFALRFADGRQRSYFVEIDRDTMPVVRGDARHSGVERSSILRKLQAYAGMRASKRHVQEFGWRTFRVLFVTPTLARVTAILDAVCAFVPAHKDLFLAVDQATLTNAQDILAVPWTSADGEPQSLATANKKTEKL